MVGQQSFYTVKEKQSNCKRPGYYNEASNKQHKHPPPTQTENKQKVPRQLGEIRVKRRYLPPYAQPFSSMNHYPLSKLPFGMITSVEVQGWHDAQLPHTCEPEMTLYCA